MHAPTIPATLTVRVSQAEGLRLSAGFLGKPDALTGAIIFRLGNGASVWYEGRLDRWTVRGDRAAVTRLTS